MVQVADEYKKAFLDNDDSNDRIWRTTTDLAVRKGGPHPLQEQPALGERVLRFLDLWSTSVFAFEGAVVAMDAGHMDLLGCTIVGTVVAIGGGTLRDLILTAGTKSGAPRPFWIDDPIYVWISVLTAAVTLLLWPALRAGDPNWNTDMAIFIALDGLGLATFAVVGCINGISANIDSSLCVLSGMMTATFGGVMRDVLTFQPVRIMHSDKELYASCAILGSIAYLLSKRSSLPSTWRMVIGTCVTCLVRFLAVVFAIKLPTVRDVENIWGVRSISNVTSSL